MLKALGTKLVVERVERDQQTASGIFITNQADPNPLAKVLSVGSQVKIDVCEGDRVSISWNNTAPQPYQGKTYHVVDETGVFAVERDND
jgi:co-chaperonin GroES (HSP10)